MPPARMAVERCRSSSQYCYLFVLVLSLPTLVSAERPNKLTRDRGRLAVTASATATSHFAAGAHTVTTTPADDAVGIQSNRTQIEINRVGDGHGSLAAFARNKDGVQTMVSSTPASSVQAVEDVRQKTSLPKQELSKRPSYAVHAAVVASATFMLQPVRPRSPQLAGHERMPPIGSTGVGGRVSPLLPKLPKADLIAPVSQRYDQRSGFDPNGNRTSKAASVETMAKHVANVSNTEGLTHVSKMSSKSATRPHFTGRSDVSRTPIMPANLTPRTGGSAALIGQVLIPAEHGSSNDSSATSSVSVAPQKSVAKSIQSITSAGLMATKPAASTQATEFSLASLLHQVPSASPSALILSSEIPALVPLRAVAAPAADVLPLEMLGVPRSGGVLETQTEQTTQAATGLKNAPISQFAPAVPAAPGARVTPDPAVTPAGVASVSPAAPTPVVQQAIATPTTPYAPAVPSTPTVTSASSGLLGPPKSTVPAPSQLPVASGSASDVKGKESDVAQGGANESGSEGKKSDEDAGNGEEDWEAEAEKAAEESLEDMEEGMEDAEEGCDYMMQAVGFGVIVAIVAGYYFLPRSILNALRGGGRNRN
eukprot:TRINITY_DN8891_c0_g1_i2.p1 TRINITY_DN8891_c0_g1~~TRINITY_DN8891_c0_g1_i2.p1  ORF type:complete len:596 (-),score=76.08 TRINITY_DN8891_c0_g1_i2:152-1939(-)